MVTVPPFSVAASFSNTLVAFTVLPSVVVPSALVVSALSARTPPTAPVKVRRLTHDDIRSGRWRRETAVAIDDEVAPTPPAPAAVPAAVVTSAYWVQLGAFRQRQGAHDLRQQLARELAWLEPWLAIVDDSALFRLQAGPFATRDEAQGTAERIRGEASLQPVVLQRR